MNRRLLGLGAFRLTRGVTLTSLLCCSGCGDPFRGSDGGDQARGESDFGLWWGGGEGETSRGPYVCRDNPDFSDLTGPELRALKSVLVDFCNNNKQASVVLKQSPDKGDLVDSLDEADNDCLNDPAKCDAAPQVVQVQPDMLSRFAKCSGTEGGLRTLPVPEEAMRYALGLGVLEEAGDQRDDGLVTLDSAGNVKKDPYRWFTRHMSCGLGTSVWMLPMGVHHVNRLFYNRDGVSEVLGIDFDPTTMSLDDWLAMGERSRAALESAQTSFIALPNTPKDAWVLSMLALENVRVALSKGTHRLPESMGEAELAAAVMRQLERIRDLAFSSVYTGAELTERDAFEKVKNGEALFAVMGDWKQVEVTSDASIGMGWFPGTQNVRVYAADGIAVFDRQGDGAMSNPQKAFVTAANRSRTNFALAKGATEISQWMEVTLKACVTDAGQNSCYVVPALSLDNKRWVGDRGAALSAWWNYPSAGNAAGAKEALVPVPSQTPEEKR